MIRTSISVFGENKRMGTAVFSIALQKGEGKREGGGIHGETGKASELNCVNGHFYLVCVNEYTKKVK